MARWHQDPNGLVHWSKFLGAEGEASVTEDSRHPINAVICRGAHCGSMSAHFIATRNLSQDKASDFWTHWIGKNETLRGDPNARASERKGPVGSPSLAACGYGFVVSGIECNQEDCSNLRLRCGVPNMTAWTVSDDNLEMGTFTTLDDIGHVYSTCGGISHMDRYVLYGVRCTGGKADHSIADCAEKRLLCKHIKDRPHDCQWSQWGTWGPCSDTCGGGWMWRNRTAANQTFGGAPCGGNEQEQAQCNAFPCEQPAPPSVNVSAASKAGSPSAAPAASKESSGSTAPAPAASKDKDKESSGSPSAAARRRPCWGWPCISAVLFLLLTVVH